MTTSSVLLRTGLALLFLVACGDTAAGTPPIDAGSSADVVAADSPSDAETGTWCRSSSTFCDSFDDRTDPKGAWDSLLAPSAPSSLALDGAFSLTPPHAAHFTLMKPGDGGAFTKVVNGTAGVVRFSIYIRSLGSVSTGVTLASMRTDLGAVFALALTPTGVELRSVCPDPNILGCGSFQVAQKIVTGKWIDAYIAVGADKSVADFWDGNTGIGALAGAMGKPVVLGSFTSVSIGPTPDPGETLTSLEVAYDDVSIN